MYTTIISPAFALALDQKLNPSIWKTVLEKDHKTPSMLIQDFYHMSLSEAKKRTEIAMSNPNYAYENTNKVIEKLIQPYLEQIAITETKYRNLPGIELQVDLLPLRFKVMHYDDGYKITRDLNILTGVTTKFESPNIIFEYEKLPIIYFQDYTGLFSHNNILQKFKIAGNTLVKIDGKLTTVEKLLLTHQKFRFSNLIIKNSEMNLEATNHQGVLDCSDQKLIIKFDPLRSQQNQEGIGKHHAFMRNSSLNKLSLPKKIT